jgi:hypothetical protein
MYVHMHVIELYSSLVPRPSNGGGGEGRPACACAVFIQILNNPITYMQIDAVNLHAQGTCSVEL